MRRRSLKAILVAVMIATPFAVATPSANARNACYPFPATFCAHNKESINIDEGPIHACITLNRTCD
jgi:hypothetical protein